MQRFSLPWNWWLLGASAILVGAGNFTLLRDWCLDRPKYNVLVTPDEQAPWRMDSDRPFSLVLTRNSFGLYSRGRPDHIEFHEDGLVQIRGSRGEESNFTVSSES